METLSNRLFSSCYLGTLYCIRRVWIFIESSASVSKLSCFKAVVNLTRCKIYFCKTGDTSARKQFVDSFKQLFDLVSMSCFS